jgi:basic membrane protein A
MVSGRVKVAGAVVALAAVGFGVYKSGVVGDADTTKKSFSVAMVTDVGGVDDKSFNQSAWEGLSKWGKENGLKEGKGGYTYFESKTAADFAPNFQQAVSGGYQLIAGIGYATKDALVSSAKANTDTKYLQIDDVVSSKYKNVASVTFHSEQSSYLVGVAAATKAKELGNTSVGFIGGVKGSVLDAFEAGYVAGVKSVDANMTVDVQYAGSFTDAAKGKTIANAMFTKGTRVIFHAAGPAGNGVFTAAKDIDVDLPADSSDKAWVIGVDMDQADMGKYTAADGKKSNLTLTSSVKGVGNGIALIAEKAKDGKFPGGKHIALGLKEDGVSITTKNLNDTEKAAVEAAKAKIVAGDVVVPTMPGE